MDPIFECKDCGATFDKKRGLTTHAQVHNTEICPVCREEIPKRWMAQHIDRNHPEVRQREWEAYAKSQAEAFERISRERQREYEEMVRREEQRRRREEERRHREKEQRKREAVQGLLMLGDGGKKKK